MWPIPGIEEAATTGETGVRRMVGDLDRIGVELQPDLMPSVGMLDHLPTIVGETAIQLLSPARGHAETDV